jgi:hypothetical protein
MPYEAPRMLSRLPPGVGLPQRSENGYVFGYLAFIALRTVYRSSQVFGTGCPISSRMSVRIATE